MATKCPACGSPMEGDKCEYCGYKQEPVAKPEAVSPQQSQPVQTPQIIINQTVLDSKAAGIVSGKSKTVAFVLCLFLGFLGAHRFYVGKTGSGLLYLFTVGICGIGWLVDLIFIATGRFKDHYDLPLKK